MASALHAPLLITGNQESVWVRGCVRVCESVCECLSVFVNALGAWPGALIDVTLAVGPTRDAIDDDGSPKFALEEYDLGIE